LYCLKSMAFKIINGAGNTIPTPVKNTGLKVSELCGEILLNTVA
jgi:hypothetical protein